MRGKAIICMCAMLASASAAQNALGETMGDRVDASAAQCVLNTYSADTMPAVSAAIVSRDGVVWTGVSQHSGQGGEAGVNEATLFPLGSITKVYVSTIILQLVEEGGLSLDDTVASLLGEQAHGIPNADSATIETLLNHTSGIPSWEDDPDWIRKGRGEALDAAHVWAPAETLDYIRGADALFPAGQEYAYSNTDHTLLGLIIEKVTGASLIAQLDRRIRGPLGLTETWLEGHEAFPETRRAQRFHHNTEAFRTAAGLPPGAEPLPSGLFTASQTNLSPEWAAGGMVSTAREVAAFGWALASGALLPPDQQKTLETFREIDAPWAPDVYGPGGQISTGHGVFEIRADGFRVRGHGGDVLGGSAALFWNEEEGFAVALLTNVGSMHTGGGMPTAGRVFFSNPLLRKTARAWGQPVSQADEELQVFLEASCN